MSTRKVQKWWWVDFRMHGIRYRVRCPENSQVGAKRYEVVLRGRLAAGESLLPAPERPTSPTFAEFSAEWFTTHVKTSNKPSSQRSRAHVLRNHLVPFFGTTRLTDISTSSIERYKALKIRGGLSPKTINEHLGLLRKCLGDAREWERPVASPKFRTLRAQKPKFDCLTREEAKRIVGATNSLRWEGMVTLALHTGLRRGELFGLRWQDVDFENAVLTVRQSIVEGIAGPPKNYRERTVPLDSDAIRSLASMPRTHDLVFHRGDGRPLTCSTAQNALYRACKRASLRPIGWHTFRHTFASWLAAAGVPIPVIQALLGHSTILMTMRYTHLVPTALRQAVTTLSHEQPVPFAEFWATGGQQNAFPASAQLAASIA
ncbi:MAG: site-specific integrase [Polyangia bacterium]